MGRLDACCLLLVALHCRFCCVDVCFLLLRTFGHGMLPSRRGLRCSCSRSKPCWWVALVVWKSASLWVGSVTRTDILRFVSWTRYMLYSSHRGVSLQTRSCWFGCSGVLFD